MTNFAEKRERLNTALAAGNAYANYKSMQSLEEIAELTAMGVEQQKEMVF